MEYDEFNQIINVLIVFNIFNIVIRLEAVIPSSILQMFNEGRVSNMPAYVPILKIILDL